MIQKQCKYCDRILEGYTEKQVDHLYLMHIISEHKDKIHLEGEEE